MTFDAFCVWQVRASDADESDSIVYSLRRDSSHPFTVSPNSGNVYVTDSKHLHAGVYRFRAIATDSARHRSEPAHIVVNVIDDAIESKQRYSWRDAFPVQSKSDARVRRQIARQRQFVADREPSTTTESIALFSVASYDPVVPEERFALDTDAPLLLSIDATSGVISRDVGHSWGSDDVDMFGVVITRVDDADCKLITKKNS